MVFGGSQQSEGKCKDLRPDVRNRGLLLGAALSLASVPGSPGLAQVWQIPGLTGRGCCRTHGDSLLQRKDTKQNQQRERSHGMISGRLLGAWPRRHPLPGTYPNSRHPEGSQGFYYKTIWFGQIVSAQRATLRLAGTHCLWAALPDARPGLAPHAGPPSRLRARARHATPFWAPPFSASAEPVGSRPPRSFPDRSRFPSSVTTALG